jgi:hypothetical protein
VHTPITLGRKLKKPVYDPKPGDTNFSQKNISMISGVVPTKIIFFSRPSVSRVNERMTNHINYGVASLEMQYPM